VMAEKERHTRSPGIRSEDLDYGASPR
jgi:hypothetical protein